MTLSKRIFYVALTAFCVVYSILSMLQLEVGTFANPGPGFVPEFLGVISVVLSAALLISSFRRPLEEKKEESSEKGSLVRLGLYVLACFVFLPLFDFLGSLLSVWILVFLLSKISGLKGWWRPAALGFVTSSAFYWLFAAALQVPLPQGLIDFV